MAEQRSWPERDPLGRPIITAAEMDGMTSDDIARAVEQRIITDPSTLPPDVLARLLGDDEEVLARSERLRKRREAADQLRRARAS